MTYLEGLDGRRRVLTLGEYVPLLPDPLVPALGSIQNIVGRMPAEEEGGRGGRGGGGREGEGGGGGGGVTCHWNGKKQFIDVHPVLMDFV